jgi:hypothetical protein
MRELRLTDGELQKLVAPAIRAHLKTAGFHTGASSCNNNAFFFPINLDLAGDVRVTRHEDGTWVFTQETYPALAERTDDCEGLLVSALMRRDQPLAKE